MTCKECIHDGVCHIQEMSTDLELEEYIREFGCEDFKNKTDFVEVPCKCKNCNHAYINYFSAQSGVVLCRWWTNRAKGIQVTMQQDDYCSYGEPVNYGSSKND